MSVLSVPGIIRGGQVEKLGDGERATFTVGAAQAATGGLGVESMAGDRVVRTWQAASVVTQGVAIHDQAAAGKVTVAMMGVWMMSCSGVIGAGNRVIAGAAGVVVVAGAAPDTRGVVGRILADAAGGDLQPVKLQ